MLAPSSNTVQIKALIAHNSDYVLESLRERLSHMPCVEAVTDCLTVEEMRAAINRYQPNLVLVNEDMIKASGSTFPAQRDCATFFFRSQGTQEFVYESSHLQTDALEAVVAEAQKRLRRGSLSERQVQKTKRLWRRTARGDKIAFKTGNRLITLDADEVYWLETADRGTVIHTRFDSFRTPWPLSTFVARRNQNPILRISGRIAVNVNNVRELRMCPGEATVVLVDGQDIAVQRGYLRNLKKMMEQVWKATA
jgi:hypothetical protein